jgi:hypothetical protein
MKTLAYWTGVLSRAEANEKTAKRNFLVYRPYGLAPKRWKKLLHSRWWCGYNAMHYRGLRKRWLRHRRLARLARREFEKASRRVAYAQERIAALEKLTAWDRVLRGPVV